MLVKEVMTHNPKAIDANTTLHEAAYLMKEMRVGCLPVFDDGRLAGMLTDRDIVMRAVAKGLDPTKTPVREAASWLVFSCPEDAHIDDAARIMEENKVRRLPVLNKEGQLVGLVSLTDIALETHDGWLVDEVLERVSQPF